MLPGFEEITSELTAYEKETLLPKMIRGLSTKIGKVNAVTNLQIVTAMKSKGYKISGVRVRKLVNYIRNNGEILGLVASSLGYYITDDPEDVKRYIESLEGRESEIRRVKQRMQKYLSDIVNKPELKF